MRDPRAPGATSDIRRAATLLLLREHRGRLEVLMLRRSDALRYLGGTWAFPGGALDEADCAPELLERIPSAERERCRRRLGGLPEAEAEGLYVAACRETYEECGVLLERDRHPDVGRLVLWSRWITPAAVPTRFDTVFFAAPMPSGQTARADTAEATEVAWVETGAAVGLAAPPTQLTLADVADGYARHGSLDALLVAEAERPVPPIMPKLVQHEDARVAIFPWDAEYTAAPGEGIELAQVPPHLARLPSRVVPADDLRIRT